MRPFVSDADYESTKGGFNQRRMRIRPKFSHKYPEGPARSAESVIATSALVAPLMMSLSNSYGCPEKATRQTIKSEHMPSKSHHKP
jgi:hypothetical protein